MKLVVVAVGKIKDKHLRAVADDYKQRLGRYVRVEELEVKDGAARLDGRVGDLLPGRRGPLTLLAVVRPADAPPVSADALMAALEVEQPPEGTRWVRYDFLVARD